MAASAVVRIEPIWRHEELIPTIAQWHWDEWGHSDSSGSLESWTSGLAARNRIHAVPTTYLAFSVSGEPIGSVVLVENDMDTHPELAPWLAGLFVLPDYRGKRVGASLTRHATDCATSMGYERLYLYTSTARSLYERLGWRVLFREFYEGEMVDVMVHDV